MNNDDSNKHKDTEMEPAKDRKNVKKSKLSSVFKKPETPPRPRLQSVSSQTPTRGDLTYDNYENTGSYSQSNVVDKSSTSAIKGATVDNSSTSSSSTKTMSCPSSSSGTGANPLVKSSVTNKSSSSAVSQNAPLPKTSSSEKSSSSSSPSAPTVGKGQGNKGKKIMKGSTTQQQIWATEREIEIMEGFIENSVLIFFKYNFFIMIFLLIPNIVFPIVSPTSSATRVSQSDLLAP